MNPAYFLPPVPGVHRREALFVFRYCLHERMSWKRAHALAIAASYGQNCWAFQKKIALWAKCCVRTVQRAMNEAKTLGIIRSRRSRRGEIPENGRGWLKCGFAMRTFNAWGLRSLRRISGVCARYAEADAHRRMRAAQNRQEKPEIREAIAEFRALRP